MRFFGYIPKIDHTWLTRFTHIDYDREIAIVATIPPTEGKTEAIIGIVRIIEDAWREADEYSILNLSSIRNISVYCKKIKLCAPLNAPFSSLLSEP